MMLNTLSIRVITIIVLIILIHCIYKIFKRRSLTSLFLFLSISISLTVLWINYLGPRFSILEALTLIYLGVNVGLYFLYNLNTFRNLISKFQ